MKMLLVSAVTRLLSLIHPRVAGPIAGLMAFFIWRFSSRLRDVSLKNLALCFPDMSATDRTRTAKAAMVHYARNILEAGIAWHWPRHRFDKLFLEPEGAELLEAGRASGRGVIVLAPHCGSWEFLGLRVTQDVGGAILYKPGRHADIEAKLVETRQRFGTTMLPASRRGLKGLYAFLRRGEVVGILPDQEPRAGEGRFAPFFGVPALTGVLACRLARRTGAMVVFGVCVRCPRGRYRIHFLAAGEDIHAADLDRALAALNHGVERCIAIAPEQYLWAYKRFRARPEGQARLY